MSPEKFHPQYIPIIDMGVDSDIRDDKGRCCHLLRAEAYHSPSLVFKDYSMQVVGQYLNYFSKRKQGRGGDTESNVGDVKAMKKSNVLICTTGDTGSSAIQALRGRYVPYIILSSASRLQCTSSSFYWQLYSKIVSQILSMLLRRTLRSEKLLLSYELISIFSHGF